MTPEEFEKKINLIETILKEEGAKVKWNDKLPDPDNPKQMRQVDVSIKRDGKLTLVECRLHKKPQNVKWIEELHGKRISLNADAVIAVSASGFTENAIRKSDRLGVILRDFKTLTDAEIKDWGLSTDVYLDYITFSDVIFYIISEYTILNIAIDKNNLFQEPNGKPWPIKNIFTSVAKKLDNINRDEGGIRLQLFTKKLIFGGKQINEILFQSDYQKKEIMLELPSVYVYEQPYKSGIDKLYLEGNKKSSFEIIKNSKSAFLILDLSIAPPLESSIFKGIRFDFKKPIMMRGYKFIGQKIDTFSFIPFKISKVTKGSAFYHSLFSNRNYPLILPS